MSATVSRPTYTAVRSSRAYEATKRALDIAISSTILIGLAPLWLLVTVAVRLTSSGPALYKAEVAGRFGRPFTYYKFRSMHCGASDEVQRRFRRDLILANRPYRLEQTADGKERLVYKVVDDPRVTPVGRIIRKLSIDEVPQFINVLRGEMSVVGPRPPLFWEVQYYQPWHWERLAVKPGITGAAQVRSRQGLPFDEMAKIDIDYARRRSLRLDFALILRTPLALLRDMERS
jgi:lipopolysaccharide/colanic/teichoic acid biosynthesis glycosyltransferase